MGRTCRGDLDEGIGVGIYADRQSSGRYVHKAAGDNEVSQVPRASNGRGQAARALRKEVVIDVGGARGVYTPSVIHAKCIYSLYPYTSTTTNYLYYY